MTLQAPSMALRGRRGFLAAALFLGGLASPLIARAQGDDMTATLDTLVHQIQAEVRASASQLGFSTLDPRVEAALRAVPRHRFVPEPERARAYLDAPLPIGEGQTISQPFIVAIMSQLLQVEPGDRVYELGTGSGYQAAVLAAMGIEVYSVEIVPELAERAGQRLRALGYTNVQVRAGDGWLGWAEAAPFDAIILTAAAPRIPRRLVDQLAPGGRLVMPMGDPRGTQQLAVFVKDQEGALTRHNLLSVRFVPVTGSMEP